MFSQPQESKIAALRSPNHRLDLGNVPDEKVEHRSRGLLTNRRYEGQGSAFSFNVNTPRRTPMPGGGVYTALHEFPKHYWPIEGSGYWAPDSNVSEAVRADKPILEKSNITCVVPFFNEEADELQRTLSDLYHQAVEVAEYGYRFHVMLVMDGWFKASDSMRHYMRLLFPDEPNRQPWCEHITPIVEGDEHNAVTTFTLQRLTHERKVAPVCVGWTKDGKAMWMKVSLLIKKDNRRKSNSHEWFLESFAPHYNSEFIFLTDCGTSFERGCLFRLTRHLTTNPACVACTGRQRVMTKELQGIEHENLMEGMWRKAQCFDYESSQAAFTGAFSLCGMLPVLPGPCGLYRFSRIYDRKAREVRAQWRMVSRQLEEQGVPTPFKDNKEYIDAIEFYCELGKQNPDETGMIEGNLLLAEDRILSYASVLKPTWPAVRNNCCSLTAPYSEYVPTAVFYFEAETNPEKLLQQRRRWINGTVAGYWWLLISNPQLISQSPLRCFFQTNLIRLLIVCQLLMSFITMMSPGIFGVAFHFAVEFTFKKVDALNSIEPYAIWFLIAYMLLYLAFAVRHSFGSLSKLSRPLYYTVLLVNMVVSMWVIAGLVLSIVYDGFGLLQYVVLGQFVMPFVLGLHSPTSLGHMLISAPSFYLLLPTMVGFFSVYAFSRTWELTWGNRPSDKLQSMKASKTKEEVDAVKFRLQVQAKFISLLAITLNMAVAFTFIMVQPIKSQLMWVGIFIFGASLLQMFFSVIFLIKFRIMSSLGSIMFCLKWFFCARCSRKGVFRAERKLRDKHLIKGIKATDFGMQEIALSKKKTQMQAPTASGFAQLYTTGQNIPTRAEYEHQQQYQTRPPVNRESRPSIPTPIRQPPPIAPRPTVTFVSEQQQQQQQQYGQGRIQFNQKSQ